MSDGINDGHASDIKGERHQFEFCNSSKGLCDCGEERSHPVHIPPPVSEVNELRKALEFIRDKVEQHRYWHCPDSIDLGIALATIDAVLGQKQKETT